MSACISNKLSGILILLVSNHLNNKNLDNESLEGNDLYLIHLVFCYLVESLASGEPNNAFKING